MIHFLPGTWRVSAKTVIVIASSVNKVVRNEGLDRIVSMYVAFKSPGKEDAELAITLLFVLVEFVETKRLG